MIELTEDEKSKIDYAMRRFTYDIGIIERTVAEIATARMNEAWIAGLEHGAESENGFCMVCGEDTYPPLSECVSPYLV